MSSLSPWRAQAGHSRGVLPAGCPPSRPAVRRRAIAGACCEPGVLPLAPVCAELPQPGRAARQVPSLSPRRAQIGHNRVVLPARCPPSRPGVRRTATAGACCPLGALPLAPLCADWSQHGRAACQVSSLSPRCAQTGHSRGVFPARCRRARPGVRRTPTTGPCADRSHPGRAACEMSSLSPGCAQNGHSRGVLPVGCPPYHLGVCRTATAGTCCLRGVLPLAPACARRPQPGRDAYQMSSLLPRCAQTGLNWGVQPARCPPSLPACADRPQPGRVASQVSSLSPRRAQTGHNQVVLRARCPPSRPGVRRTATAGACCQIGALPLAPLCADWSHQGRAAC